MSTTLDIEMPPNQYVFCAATIVIGIIATMCSVWFILSMTFERFYSIIMPHKAASVNTVKKAKKIIITIILFSVLFSIPHIFVTSHRGKECVSWGKGLTNWAIQVHYYVSVILNFALPFALLLIMNTFIIHTLRTRSVIKIVATEGQGQSEGQTLKIKNSERQIYILLLLVTFAFLILTIPGYANIAYMSLHDYTKSPKSFADFFCMYQIGQKTYFTNYGINFFLYVISGQKFRSDLINLFKCKNKGVSNINAISNSFSMSTLPSSV